jgi:hypothetical protein
LRAAKCSWDAANRALAENYLRVIDRHAALMAERSFGHAAE